MMGLSKSKRFDFSGIFKAFLFFSIMSVILMTLPVVSYSASVACDGQDLTALKDDMASLKKDMGEIKRVLIAVLPALVNSRGGAPGVQPGVTGGRKVQQRVPTTATVSLSGGESLGNKDAKVAIVEFSDFQCSFCGRFYNGAFKEIRKNFVDTGKVVFVYKDFPLPFHEHAMKAALASHCASDQGKYWKMNDVLFENQRDLSDMKKLAGKAGLDISVFEKCMKSEKSLDDVKANIDEGREIGVRGTPSFVIGRVKDGKVTGVIVPGAAPYATFRDNLNNVLTGK